MEILNTFVFYTTWSCIFIICYYISKYQFKYCVPVCLELAKLFYAILLLLLIRLYYLLRVENMEFNWVQIKDDLIQFFAHVSKMEL